MGEEKRNRITAAITINAVLLVFIIVAVLIAQIVQISVLTRRKNALLEEYYRIERQLNESEDILEKLQLDEEYRDVVIKLSQMGVDVIPKNEDSGN